MNLGAKNQEECMLLEICSFYGTEYNSKGQPLVCGEKSVGVGTFELQGSNLKPKYESLCERHKTMYMTELTEILT